ncbi:hypothetical protein CHARACLAT_029487 [Characodon lateralis]|uniref:Uncharacterized protein n=1 Tax=Characodon lateralis TaxID=208331 RepID=A0ABU7EFB0_9TELE|nr:hypothetical protein [Characodon lateralis]
MRVASANDGSRSLCKAKPENHFLSHCSIDQQVEQRCAAHGKESRKAASWTGRWKTVWRCLGSRVAMSALCWFIWSAARSFGPRQSPATAPLCRRLLGPGSADRRNISSKRQMDHLERTASNYRQNVSSDLKTVE